MKEVPEKDASDIQKEIGKLVSRALIQAGDMQDAQEKLEKIVKRTSKVTPPPEPGAQ